MMINLKFFQKLLNREIKNSLLPGSPSLVNGGSAIVEA
jgi:hypothetical protein